MGNRFLRMTLSGLALVMMFAGSLGLHSARANKGLCQDLECTTGVHMCAQVNGLTCYEP